MTYSKKKLHFSVNAKRNVTLINLVEIYNIGCHDRSIRNSYSAFTSKTVIIEKHKNTVEKLTSLTYDLKSKKHAKTRESEGGGGGECKRTQDSSPAKNTKNSRESRML